AVHPDVEYAWVRRGDETLILAKDLVERVLGGEGGSAGGSTATGAGGSAASGAGGSAASDAGGSAASDAGGSAASGDERVTAGEGGAATRNGAEAGYTIVKTMLGRELDGMRYERLFD